MAKTQMANRVRVLVRALQGLWEATSFELDKLQLNPACAEQEDVENRHKPTWTLTYEPRATPAEWLPVAGAGHDRDGGIRCPPVAACS